MEGRSLARMMAALAALLLAIVLGGAGQGADAAAAAATKGSKGGWQKVSAHDASRSDACVFGPAATDVLMLGFASLRSDSNPFRGPHDPPLDVQLYKAIGKAPYHVLAMDDQKFHDMMMEPGRKRDFPVVALFTAAAPKYGCTPCQ